MTEFRAAAAETAPATPPLVADPPAILVGASAAMERLRRDVLRTAARNQPVLIVGERGSGKSLVARALHEQGPRAASSCAVVACEVFPETLLEAELFGWTSGIVLGAVRERHGVFESSSGGTVILDNLDVASARAQALVARFVAEGIVQPLGGAARGGPGTAVDTRTVATGTIEGEARARIHSELASSLGARLIYVPSLRERRSDIPALAQFFAAGPEPEQRRVAFSAAALSALTAYSWPGNVRQLRIVIERIVATGRSGEIQPNELPVGIRPRADAGAGARVPSVGEELFARVQASGESFWLAVYPLFMKREITRADLRDLVRRAQEVARGNADALVAVLNMPRSDSQRFLRFLRKYDCGVYGVKS
jgi:DNA-binding NtrC family response regulator